MGWPWWRVLEGDWIVEVPVSEVIPQFVALLPIVMSAVLVSRKRRVLPFPKMWGGILIGILLAVLRRVVYVGFLLTGRILWLHLYNAMLFVVPSVMFVVAWSVVSAFEEQNSRVRDLEGRYRDAMTAFERQIREGDEARRNGP
jgi:hypothetical protein